MVHDPRHGGAPIPAQPHATDALNDEQVVLDFFTRPENLPLAMVAAEHLDELRRELNNAFWQDMGSRLDALLAEHGLPWRSNPTEDRNLDDCLVGVHLQPASDARIFLRPFMEQQFSGDSYRIYFGLIWSSAPDGAQNNLPQVTELAQTMESAGFRKGDDIFAWLWLPWHPRSRAFLTSFGMQREAFMKEVMQPWEDLLLEFGELLQRANLALENSGNNATVSLESLRSTLPPRKS